MVRATIVMLIAWNTWAETDMVRGRRTPGDHWDYSQVHPFVIYYTSEDQLKYMNLCIVSDCFKHDTVTVHPFILAMVSYLKTTLQSVKKMIPFNDGAASQYKNFKYLTNLCCHKNDHGVDAEWHLFWQHVMAKANVMAFVPQ